MKKRFKIGFVVLVILVVVGFGIYSSSLPMEVEITDVQLSDGGVYFVEKGTVKLNEEKLVYSEVNGNIIEILAKEKDVVKKGDVLAIIDDSDIDFQILSLEATISGYEAQKENADAENNKYILTLENGKKELESQLQILKTTENHGDLGNQSQLDIQKVITAQALVQYENAKNELDKNQILFDNGIISLNEYTKLKNHMENSKNEYEKAMLQLETIETVGTGNSEEYFQATYNSLQTQIEGINKQINESTTEKTKKYYDTLIKNANISIDQLKDSKNKFIITSPYDGEIKSVEIENTNVVTMVSPAFIIKDSTEDIIESFVSTRDINSVAVDDEVNLIFKNRGGDITISGKVVDIGEEAVIKLTPLGVEERAVLVKIIPEENDFLKKGYEVDVKYELINGSDKIVIPANATYKKDGMDMVMVVTDNVIVEREVKIGYELITGKVVDSGLDLGEKIISDVTTKGLKIGGKVTRINN